MSSIISFFESLSSAKLSIMIPKMMFKNMIVMMQKNVKSKINLTWYVSV